MSTRKPQARETREESPATPQKRNIDVLFHVICYLLACIFTCQKWYLKYCAIISQTSM